MGNHKLRWTPEEEAALKAGVAKHGAGKWKNILVDADFARILANRSNVDLKDKWRNMGAYTGPGSGANAMAPKGKATATGSQPPKSQNSSPVVSKDKINEKPSQSLEGVKNASKYNEMILEALSSIKDHNGSDLGEIMRFIEKKYKAPQNFRRLLSSKLRKLVEQGRLEKVQKRYKIKHATLGTKTPSPKQKDVRPKRVKESKSKIPDEIVEDAAKTAAYKIAEAEHQSCIAAEKVKESERISQMAEDTEAVLMRLKEIFEQCQDGTDNTNSKSSEVEVILMA